MRAFSCAWWWLPVTRQRRWSHSICHNQKPQATCKPHGSEPELWSSKVLQCGNKDFRPFCSCDLDLDPLNFIYELDPYSWRYTWRVNTNFLRQGFQKLSSNRQKDRQTDTAEIIYHTTSQAVNDDTIQIDFIFGKKQTYTYKIIALRTLFVEPVSQRLRKLR